MYIYRLLTGADDSVFCCKVSKALIEGWVLYGEPKYSFDGAAKMMRCAQAVTKEVQDQKFDAEKSLGDY